MITQVLHFAATVVQRGRAAVLRFNMQNIARLDVGVIKYLHTYPNPGLERAATDNDSIAVNVPPEKVLAVII